MSQTITEDHGSFFVVKVVDEDGNIELRPDGTERRANSRFCRDPYKAVQGNGRVALIYSGRGIV